MKRILFSVAVLCTALASTGCLCNPCGGGMYGLVGGCGLGQPVGVGYNECVGPAACTEDCGPVGGTPCDPCSPMGGCGTFGGNFVAPGCGGFPCISKCVTGVGTTLHGIGQIGAGILCVPVRIIGGICTLGTCGTYAGCGCSSEVYYGDDCAAGMDGYSTGCRKCDNGYTEGIQYSSEPDPVVTPDQGTAIQPPRSVRQVAYQQQIPTQKWMPAQQQYGTHRR